jgi:hypothetical protein
VTREQLRTLALGHAGFLPEAKRVEWSNRAEAVPKLDSAGAMLWQSTITSLRGLKALGLDGEQALIDAYFEAHVDVLLAIVEKQR